MGEKLYCVLVDDDPLIHDIFREYLKDCEFVEMVGYYQNPIEFLKSNKKTDLVFIDIVMPEMNGFELARIIKPTHVVLFTGDKGYFKDILNELGPVDAFAKPITKERLLASLDKAYKLNFPELEKNMKPSPKYTKFKAKGKEGKVLIKTEDILYVTTDYNDHRNKEVIMANGTEYIIMDYTMFEILTYAPHLLQPNQSVLVDIDFIISCGQEHISVRKFDKNGNPKMVIIGDSYSEEFHKHFV